jgi:lycopene beta-cyclase
MTHDVLLVGGGLANALIGLRLCTARPTLRIALVEREAAVGGRHTWSYHVGDLGPGDHEWLEPLVTRSWPRHEVRFPRLSGLLLGRSTATVRPDAVVLEDGTTLTARCVIDGRGYLSDWLVAGFQKFVGQHVTLSEAHGLEAPLLMDATVEQVDGFRFVYVLPWTTHRLLIEDTYYTDDPELQPELLRARIGEYARDRGWPIAQVDDEEQGVLPIPLAGELDRLWRQHAPGVPTSGMRAGLFHHTTGYSLPGSSAF